MDFFGTQKRPFLRKSHFFLSSRAAFISNENFHISLAHWSHDELSHFDSRHAAHGNTKGLWAHSKCFSNNGWKPLLHNRMAWLIRPFSLALDRSLALSHRKRHFHIKRCCQLGDTFALVRSRMNRGRTQFADAAVWEWTRLKAKPISQRWRVAALKYSDYWWITGKNSHLLLDHRIGSRWLT